MKQIWLVESIQSISNSLWTWHDKYNICCRYCIYNVKFKVYLITKPLEVFSSATKWPNASPLFGEREMEKFVEGKDAKNTKRSANVARQVFQEHLKEKKT